MFRKAPARRPAIALCPPSSNLPSNSDASLTVARCEQRVRRSEQRSREIGLQARLEELAEVLDGILVKALRQHYPMRPEGTGPLAIYDAAQMTARAPASWDNMRKKMV